MLSRLQCKFLLELRNAEGQQRYSLSETKSAELIDKYSEAFIGEMIELGYVAADSLTCWGVSDRGLKKLARYEHQGKYGD